MSKTITKEEFDEKYVRDKTVVWCPTEVLAEEFLTTADSFGYKWYTGRRYVGNINYKIDHCYEIGEGYFSTKKYYLNKDYRVIKFNGFKDIKHDKHFKTTIKLNDENFEYCLVMSEDRVKAFLNILSEQYIDSVLFQAIDDSMLYVKKKDIRCVKTEVL